MKHNVAIEIDVPQYGVAEDGIIVYNKKYNTLSHITFSTV